VQQPVPLHLTPSACPSKLLWVNYLKGSVEQLALDSMSEHLESCSDCEKVVEVLAAPATKVHKIGKSAYLQEVNYLRMVARVEELRVASEVGDTVVDGKPREDRDRDLPIPETIGRFVVRSVLGTGGFGRVYLADDPLLNRSVAIRAPRRSEIGSDGDVSSFLNEARHAAALDHPGIVPIFDVLADDSGRTLIVMKYIDGTPLTSIQTKGTLELPHAIRILIQVASAVHYAHEHGFVHRDLKPSNILIDRQGKPHVSDLGLGLNLSQRDARLKRAGTPAYMSPEQVNHDVDKIDHRTDVWSLGVMLSELVHGRRPFPQAERQAIFNAIKFDEPLIESLAYTKSLDAIIRRCLAKVPADRYPTAEYLAEDLAEWLRQNYPTGLQRWKYGWRRNLLAATVCAVAFGGFSVGITQLKQRELRFTLRQLESAPVQQVSTLLDKLRQIHATPDAIEGFGKSSDVAGQFRLDLASIALGDRSQVTIQRCVDELENAEPEEIRALVDALDANDSVEELVDEIAARFKSPEFEPSNFRLSAALAGLSRQHAQSNDMLWGDIRQAVAKQLVTLFDVEQARWFPLFERVGALQLAEPLQALMSDSKLDEALQRNAARALARYLAETPRELATIVGDADSMELSELVSGLKSNREESVSSLKLLFGEQLALPRAVPASDWDPPTKRDSRTSKFAIALWLLGSYDPAYEALQHTADPTLQTLVIHGLAEQDLDPQGIVKQVRDLEGADDHGEAIRFGLLQVLAELPIDTAGNREFLASLKDLLNDMQMSPDAGVHGLARLVASRCGLELQPLQPGLHGKWLVDTIGQGVQDFSIIEPCVIEVGIHNEQRAPAGTASWPRHKRRFARRIAIATNEVTIEQFRVFDSTYIDDFIAAGDVMLIESVPQAAMMRVTKEAAHRFCNAWSDAAGLERCYEPKVNDQGKTQLVPKANYFLLNGYRLPTDGEWELACRAGTGTSRYFGSSAEYLTRYAWTLERKASFELASNRTVVLSQRVAQLVPNRWGMFDLYGNAAELCEMGNGPPKAVQERSSAVVEDALAEEVPPGPGWPLIRGVSLTQPGLPYAHSHCRTNSIAGVYNRDFGIRVVRTLPDDVARGD
jgi:formylglycine-generating enzyme required for sulfatase activity